MTDPQNPFNRSRAARMRELRVAAGYSQERLAKRMGIRRQEYNVLENARRTITDNTVLKFVGALGLEPSEFVFESSSNGTGHA